MAGFVIRPFRSDDTEPCRDLWIHLTNRHREIYESPAIGGDDAGRQFDQHLERVGPDRLWVADVDGEVVGLTGLIVEGAEGELEPLIVEPNHRGGGIGAALTAAVVKAAEVAELRYLNVRPVARNAEAIRFFHDRGFGVLGHIEMFMNLGGDETRWRSGERLADRDFRV
jgi:N-acetylglutamate synthase-like GNAT family acetyltransferase